MKSSFEKEDFLLPAIQGTKSLLLAILYAEYLRICITKENINSTDPNVVLKEKMEAILHQLEEDIQKCPLAQHAKPSVKDIINMMNYSERRGHKFVTKSVSEKINEKRQILKVSNKKKKQILLTKALFDLKIKSLECLKRMADNPEKYLYLRDNALRMETLKNLLYIENPVEYTIVEKYKGLKELFNSFAIIDAHVSAYFFNPLYDEPLEKEAFLILVNDQIALRQKFLESEGGRFAFNEEHSDTISEITDDEYNADLISDFDLPISDNVLDELATMTPRKKPVEFESRAEFWKSRRTPSMVVSGLSSVNTQQETVSVK